jgi:hypothetical protein
VTFNYATPGDMCRMSDTNVTPFAYHDGKHASRPVNHWIDVERTLGIIVTTIEHHPGRVSCPYLHYVVSPFAIGWALGMRLTKIDVP